MAELSGASMDAARQREEALMARNKIAAGTDVELENVLHTAYRSQTQLRDRLDRIERALEEGVARAGSLKSPAAKRAFQQFLLGKHRQIVQVLQDAKRSSADLVSQMTAVGGQYQPGGGEGPASASADGGGTVPSVSYLGGGPAEELIVNPNPVLSDNSGASGGEGMPRIPPAVLDPNPRRVP